MPSLLRSKCPRYPRYYALRSNGMDAPRTWKESVNNQFVGILNKHRNEENLLDIFKSAFTHVPELEKFFETQCITHSSLYITIFST